MLFLCELAETSSLWLVPRPGDRGQHCRPMEGGRWKVKPPPPCLHSFSDCHTQRGSLEAQGAGGQPAVSDTLLSVGGLAFPIIMSLWPGVALILQMRTLKLGGGAIFVGAPDAVPVLSDT